MSIIIKKENEQTIVIDDLLSFASCKLKTRDKSELLSCLQHFYSKEIALESLQTLIAVLPSEVSSEQRDILENNPFFSILDFLEIMTPDLPLFVCKNLNNVPKLNDLKTQTKKELYKEHEKIKTQLNEVYNSLSVLKGEFLTISEENKTDSISLEGNEILDESSTVKEITFLQSLIDNDKFQEIEEEFGEIELIEGDDKDIIEQRNNLIANRRQRSAFKILTNDGRMNPKNKKSPIKQRIIQIEKDGKTKNFSGIKDEDGFVRMSDETRFLPTTLTCSNCSFSSTDKDVFEDHICKEKNYENRYLISTHMAIDPIGVVEVHQCSACSFSSNDRNTALTHKCNKLTSPSMEKQQNAPPKNRRKRCKTYECYTCGESFTMRKVLMRHIESHVESGHRCPLCTNRFSIDEWVGHVRTCPGMVGGYSASDIYCEECDVYYADKRTLSFHKAFHDQSRPFECVECKFRFYTQKTVEDHMRSHWRYRDSAVCPFCSFRSTKQNKIGDHLRCHTGDRPYKCPQCGKGCPTYNALKVHQTSHVETRDFSCDLCEKRFKSQSKMASHRKTHTENRPHKCPVCGKGFKFGLQMALHHRMHLDIRKHACPQCSYRARTAAVLRGHMNTHENAKPFKCPHCDFGANHKSYLNWHLRYYHPADEFEQKHFIKCS